jgi:hypothetical protein
LEGGEQYPTHAALDPFETAHERCQTCTINERNLSQIQHKMPLPICPQLVERLVQHYSVDLIQVAYDRYDSNPLLYMYA